MNLNLIRADFNLAASEAGFKGVTWASVSAEALTRTLSLCSTETEVVDELISLFNHPANF